MDVFANRLCAIDEKSGALHWQSPALEAAVQNPQVVEDMGFIALEVPASKKIVFLESTTRKLREEALHSVLSSPVFIRRDAIYGTTKAILRVEIGTGSVIWSIPVESQYQVFVKDSG